MFLLTTTILNLQRRIEESHFKRIKQVYNCCWTSNSEKITSGMPLNKCHEETQRKMNKDVGADRQGFNKENTSDPPLHEQFRHLTGGPGG